MIKKTEKGYILGKLETVMRANFKMIIGMGMDRWDGGMGNFTKVNGQMEYKLIKLLNLNRTIHISSLKQTQ